MIYKRIYSVFLTIILVLTLIPVLKTQSATFNLTSNADDCKIVLKYQVNNRTYWKNGIQKGPMDASPELRYSRVNLMARYLAEEIGASVGWISATQTVSIKTLDGTTIEMQIGKSIAKINGYPTSLDPNNPSVVPYISHGRTYTPLRFISYNLGAKGPNDIIWYGDISTAELTFKDPGCNPPSNTARITGFVFASTIGNPGTTITIFDNNGDQVWVGQTDDNGYYETSAQNQCALRCPGTYKVVPTKQGCTFTNPYEMVTFINGQCCENGNYRADFQSNCSPLNKTARIIGYVTGTGTNPETKITV